MTATAALEAEARAMYEEESRKLMRASMREAREGWDHRDSGYCPVKWLLGELLDLVSEAPERPVRDLEPVIRRRVREQLFVDVCGDAPVDQISDGNAEAHIHVLLRVLEKMRQRAVRRGVWSHTPAAPVMYG